MSIRSLSALSLAAALAAFAPIASAQHDRDYRDDHRDYRHDARREHEARERERERIARERRYEYARHHDYRHYERAPRGYVVAAPVYLPPPVVYSPPPAPSGINIVVPITLP